MNKGLTSFRALAFLSIFLFHTGYLEAGYLGVTGFFVLSGFLLTPILIDMRASLSKVDFFVHFYGRRCLRIFPLYYSYIVIVSIASLLLISYYGQSKLPIPIGRFLEQLPWSLTYTYDFFHASSQFRGTMFATHFWSLAVEEQFYLIWPLAIYLIPPKHIKRFLLIVILAGPIIRFVLATILDMHIFPLHIRNDLAIYVLPFSHIDAFAMGGYFGLYGKSRTEYLVWLSIIIVIVVGVLTSWLSTNQVQWDGLGYARYMKDSYKYIWGYSILNMIFAYVLVHVRDRAFMPTLFENRILVYLGTISYGLYVIHFPMLWVTRSTMHSSPILQSSTSLILTIMISMASYELMEKRLINLKDRYFAKNSIVN